MAAQKLKKTKNSSIELARKARLDEMVMLLKTGNTETDASDVFLQRGFSPTAVLELLSKAKAEITKEFAKDRDYVVGHHLRRYDRDIQRLRTYTPRTANPARAVELKTNAYLRMIETMGQKEKLLGYHAKNFSLKVVNETVVSVKEQKKRWNLEQLTLEEKVQLLHLISKCKRSDDERYGIILNDATETVDAEVIDISTNQEPQENIKQILPVYVPIKPPDRPYVSLESAQQRLRETLQQRAKEAFKQAGSQDASLEK